MKTCACPRNRKCWVHLRAVALSESRALRLLVDAKGRIPVVTATDWGAA